MIGRNKAYRPKTIIPLVMDFWKFLECKADFMIKFTDDIKKYNRINYELQKVF
jgi:hypothetical protein